MTKNAIKHGVIRWLLWRERESGQTSGLVGKRLDPSLWGCAVDQSGALTIDGVSATELAKTYQTPLHVLSEKVLLKNFSEFQDSFRAVYPRTILATSYKTNPLPYVLSTLHKAGSHAEVISHFELWLALKLGVPPEKIILNGPGKGEDALALAVEKEVRMINLDGAGEIQKVASLAHKKGVRQRVGLRIITSVGWSSQFGLSIENGAAHAAFVEMLKNPALIPCGLHLHLGTGIQNVETYVQAVDEVLEFRRMLRARHGVMIDYIDLGGGFGVPTVRGTTDWDGRMLALGYPARAPNPATVPKPSDYAKALEPSLRELSSDLGIDESEPTIVLEPGRAITSSSQILLLSVVATKPGLDGKKLLIMDGGKNITMPLGWETHEIFPANRMRDNVSMTADIFGPLCHPGDVITKNRLLPDLGEGDLIAILDAGAYFIPNQLNFSNPRPPVVCVGNGQHYLVRRPETFEDIVRHDETAR